MSRLEVKKIDWALYAILDKQALGDRSASQIAEDVVAGGAGVIQLRNKSRDVRAFYDDAVAVKHVTDAHGIPLIINDRADVARAVGAAGVHLGQDDLPLAAARQFLGPDKIIGVSVHSMAEFRESSAKEADYCGVGTMFATRSKSIEHVSGVDFLRKLRAETEQPLVAIGGITAENLAPVLQAGADGVAVISTLLTGGHVQENAEGVRAAIRQVRQAASFVSQREGSR